MADLPAMPWDGLSSVSDRVSAMRAYYAERYSETGLPLRLVLERLLLTFAERLAQTTGANEELAAHESLAWLLAIRQLREETGLR